QHDLRWFGAHQFGDYVGVEQDHRSLEIRRGPHRAAFCWQNVDAAHCYEPGMDGQTEVLRGAGLSDNLPQDVARLFLHRPAMLGRPHAQAALHIIVEVSNRYAGHGTLRLHCQS
ncbi:MAG: hypothetical protein U1D66_05405, partial [Erythrobacter sp.]|nr:hypothetical protein [Erythrobacter sp.]